MSKEKKKFKIDMALSFLNKNEYSIVMDKYLWIVHFENYTNTNNLGVMKVPLASM